MPARNAELVRKKFDQRVVGGPVHWRGLKTDPEHTVHPSSKLRAGGSGLYTHLETNDVVRIGHG